MELIFVCRSVGLCVPQRAQLLLSAFDQRYALCSQGRRPYFVHRFATYELPIFPSALTLPRTRRGPARSVYTL